MGRFKASGLCGAEAPRHRAESEKTVVDATPEKRLSLWDPSAYRGPRMKAIGALLLNVLSALAVLFTVLDLLRWRAGFAPVRRVKPLPS